MTQSDITVEILREIRDAVRVTNDRIDLVRVDLGGRIDETNRRLDVVEGTLLDLVEQQRFTSRFLKDLSTRE